MPRPWLRRSMRNAWVLIVAIAMHACTTSEPPPAPPNFVFVLIDTLRADHVGAYGYERDTTPFIDTLAENGVVFENTIAQAPWTGASMASLWTSRYPSEVGAGVVPDEAGVRNLGKSDATKLRPDAGTLATILGREGYRTIAIVSNAYAGGHFGLLRGFDRHMQRRRDARGVTDAAIEKLDHYLAEPNRPENFFLYVHYIDAHEPTFPPQEHRAAFPGEGGDPHLERHARWDFGKGIDPEERAEFEAFRRHKIDLYDASIRFVDAQVERLARYLEAVGLRDSTVFIIASDHGEELWDHTEFELETHLDPRGLGGIGHGQSLFAELTSVPLIWSGPGIPTKRVAALVRNVDVAPTILGLAQKSASGFTPRGIDLLAAIRSGGIPSLDGFSEDIVYGFEAKSLVRDGWKLIRYSDAKTEQKEFLFHVETDPAEEQDRLRDARSEAARLGSALDGTLADLDTARGGKAEMDAETRAQLQAIGYVE